jgi:Zn-dependent peptidase ImmA (M78 family)
MSLRKLIEGAGLGLDACADVLGVDHEVFQQWADSQREMPPSYASVLAATLGIRSDALTSKALAGARNAAKVEPAAIWFKFRGNEFSDADRESILLVRRIGHNANQLELSTLGQTNRAWEVIFKTVMQDVDLQASPQDQGRQAAKTFCELNQFGHAGRGSSEILRDNLRSKGILLIESPISNSHIEGCTFYVGDSASQRPCIFVNTYKTTWFRRNVIIMHELGHAMFDHTSGVKVDVLSPDGESKINKNSLVELRAELFAQETLLSKKLLLSLCSQSGLKVSSLTPDGLAELVAKSGVEKKTVVNAMLDYALIDEALFQQYLSFDIADKLRELTDHALDTQEYINKMGEESCVEWESKKRFTSLSKQKLLLPVPYVKAVLDAVKSFKISISRASELLIIDEDTFRSRFQNLTAEVCE